MPPYGDLGVTCTVHLSMARWKARGRLPISAIWTYFASSHGWGTISESGSKSLCFKRGWVTLSVNFRGRGRRPRLLASEN